MEAPTTTSPAAADVPRVTQARPRIGVLGVMQELYDDMVPGIVERQGEYARKNSREASARRASTRVAPPAKEARPHRAGEEPLEDEGSTACSS